MQRPFFDKGTFWGMFFVGVGFGVTPGAIHSPHSQDNKAARIKIVL